MYFSKRLVKLKILRNNNRKKWIEIPLIGV